MGVDVEGPIQGGLLGRRKSCVPTQCLLTIPVDIASGQRSYTKEDIPTKSDNSHNTSSEGILCLWFKNQ